jgi:hypothetical protein
MKFEKWRDIDIDSIFELSEAEHVIEGLRAANKESWD